MITPAAPPVPLLDRRFTVLQRADPDEVRGFIARRLTPYRNVGRRGDSHVSIDVGVAALGPVGLLSGEQSGAEVDLELLECLDYFDVHFTLAGTNTLDCDSGVFVLAGWSAAVISPGMRTRMHLSDGYTQMHVRIERFALERALERALGRPITSPVRFSVPMDLADPAIASWVKALTVLVEDLQQSGGLSANELGADLWADFLILGILRAQPHNYTSALAENEIERAVPLRLRRVLKLIDAEPEGDLALDRLAEVAGVAPRSLQRDFREYLGTSPRSYVERARLEKTREDLMAAAGTSVADIAYRHGFTHTSRFAALYHKHYGEPPSTTLRNARSHGTGKLLA